MTTINNITAEFATLVPGIKADIIRFIGRRWARLETLCEGTVTYNATRKLVGEDNKQLARSLYPFLKNTGVGSMSDPVLLDEQRVEKFAQQNAEDQVASFTAKLIAKLGDLTDVKLVRIDLRSFEFTIVGKLDGAHVRVEQQVVFKTSIKGNHFCQWPARIYVDGKFTSEAAFKKLAA